MLFLYLAIQLFRHYQLKRLSFPPFGCLCSFVKALYYRIYMVLIILLIATALKTLTCIAPTCISNTVFVMCPALENKKTKHSDKPGESDSAQIPFLLQSACMMSQTRALYSCFLSHIMHIVRETCFHFCLAFLTLQPKLQASSFLHCHPQGLAAVSVAKPFLSTCS